MMSLNANYKIGYKFIAVLIRLRQWSEFEDEEDIEVLLGLVSCQFGF